jgi:hypothetical protein
MALLCTLYTLSWPVGCEKKFQINIEILEQQLLATVKGLNISMGAKC